MSPTGVLGGPGSQLGNIVLGYGSQSTAGAVGLNGVGIGEVGLKYDFAMGYDPGTGTATMVGYCIPADKGWSESTELQDIQRLIQVASPSTVDRDLTRWPKVTQGDWSRGERQETFVDTARYYISDGNIDVSQPGGMKLFNSATTTTMAMNGAFNTLPLVSDGTNWYLGISQTAGTNLLIGNSTGAMTAYTVGGGEIIDMLMTPYGVFYGTAAGIYSVTSAGVATLAIAEGISGLCRQSLAYFSDKLFYITAGDTTIHYISVVTGGASTVLVTALAFETHYSCITSTASGLFYSKYHEISATQPTQLTILYSDDGTGAGETRIGDIPGLVKQAREVNGTVYILAQLTQPAGRADYTMYTLTSSVATGAVLAILDDTRYLQFSDFWANNPTPTAYCRGSLFGNGRMLDIAWPGLKGLRLDLVSGGISRIGSNDGGFGRQNISAHRIVETTTAGMIQVIGANTTVTLSVYNAPPKQGTLTSSYIDFATPALPKSYRSVEVNLFAPLPQGASIALAYSLDSSTTFTPLPISANSSTLVTGFLPKGTKASRIKVQITLIASPTGASPIVSTEALKANLARVWKTTASCRLKQQLNNGQEDQQGYGPSQLIANFQNAYANAGRCVLFVPAPGVPGYVEQVNASLEDYTWSVSKPTARANEQHGGVNEGTIDCTFVESL
jgi:hypothetical protein